MIKKILLGGLLAFFFVLPVRAADVEIACDSGGCTNPPLPVLFSSSFIWAPGYNQTKTIRIANTDSDPLAVSNKAVNFSVTGNLDNVLNLSIRRFTDGHVVFQDTLHSFYSAGDQSLVSLGGNSSDEFFYTVEMDPEAGNEYQGKVTIFDLNLNFSGGHEEGQENNDRSSDNGSPSVPSCDKTSPVAPGNLHVTYSTANSISLAWNSVSPVTHYALIFTRISDEAKYGSTNIGIVNSYTIHNLAGGETYEFEVLAVNDCAPGPGAKVTASVLGGGVTGRPLGENNEVLGIETTLTPTPASPASGQTVLGVESKCLSQLWQALFVLLVFGVVLVISRQVGFRRWLVVVLILVVVAYIVDRLYFCDNMPWILILIIIAIVTKARLKKH